MASTRTLTASSLEGRLGAKPPSSPTAVDRPRLVQHRAQGVVRLRAPAQGLGEGGRADRHDHELLQVDVVVGVGAAVDHVHHGHRQHVGPGPADVAVQGQADLVGRGVGHGQRDAEDGVGPEAALVVGPVEVDQRRIEAPLVEGFEPLDGIGDLPVDVGDGAEHALAAVAVAAVAQLDRLEAFRSTPPRARRRGRWPPIRAGPRPRRSGCRGSRGSPGRPPARSRSLVRPVGLVLV